MHVCGVYMYVGTYYVVAEEGVFTWCGGRGAAVSSGGRVRAGRRQSAERPRPRGRDPRCVVGGVSERVPAGGGGEPRAARPTEPRLRPVFLWAKHHAGTVSEVRVEDYDHRNRIRIARTKHGWRVIPRTDIYNSIRLSPPPSAPSPLPERRPHPKRRPYKRSRRRSNRRKHIERPQQPQQHPWVPDLESHIPSHTIAIPRVPTAPTPPAELTNTLEPTPLDSLLAVAELEFNQQQQQQAISGHLTATSQEHYSYLPDEEVARDVMSFNLGEPPKTNGGEMYYQKAHVEQSEDEYQSTIGVHKDLFETISEAHYLPDLSGPHDEALLESLVEKGCEDNHILGQALDKLAHLVSGSGDYVEEEDDMLLNSAPVSDIINRLEQLESPGRNSITAAQSLLHLHHIGDHLNVPDHPQSMDQTYINNDVYVPNNPTECNLESHNSTSEIHSQINNIEYEDEPEKGLENDIVTTNLEYTTKVPEKHNEYDDHRDDEQNTLPDQSNIAVSNDSHKEDLSEEDIHEQIDDQTQHNEQEDFGAQEHESIESITELKKEEDNIEDVATDLSFRRKDDELHILESTIAATVESVNNNNEIDLSEKIELPKDFSGYRRLFTPHSNESPKRLEIPRAPSRESDAMQSPQPSGIPAVPSSPELFTVPQTKSKHTLFLETLLSSPSPKMYTSEVTITKQQCEPLNLGKHRKSASPTVSSCSDDRKLNKQFGEPHEKRSRSESTEELAKISKVFIPKTSDDSISESKIKRPDKHKLVDDNSPWHQLQALKTSPDFNIPDPLLVPKNKLNNILAAPAREIPALLIERPELRLPEVFAYPAVLQDPDILVIALSQLEIIIENDAKTKHGDKPSPSPKPTSTKPAECTKSKTPMPSMDGLAGDIDAATSAALNQMLWLPYLSQLEAAMACSQNMDFLKALNSSGYPANYQDLSQMFNHPSRFMNPSGFQMMPPMDYDSRMQFAMWQQAMNAQRAKSQSEQCKETAKSSDVQSAYVHSTKNHQNRTHSSARTSPIAHNYNNCQRGSMPHNPFLQGMYPAMNPNLRPNMPLPGLQIPYFNPNMMNSQRSPRSSQQKSPTSPYYPNNNYLQYLKQDANHQRSNSTSSQESPRPRISVKSLQNLLEPAAAAASGSRRASSSSTGRRREETEVGSTTPLGETPPQLPPHPHDPIHHLWHPLFGNQKDYSSPWSWTTVTATGD